METFRLLSGWPGIWRVLLAVVLMGSLSSQAFSGVRSSTTYRSYFVGGSSAKSLVSYMRSRPLAGDHGPAMANVRPSYALSVVTKQVGGTCRATSVNLNIRFVMTLPTARTSAMSSGTRAAWNGFVAFARRHENTHRSIYLSCANSFIAKAERMTAGNCGTLQASIRRRLAAEQSACNARHRAFDRAEASRARGLSLFRLARSAR